MNILLCVYIIIKEVFFLFFRTLFLILAAQLFSLCSLSHSFFYQVLNGRGSTGTYELYYNYMGVIFIIIELPF